MMDKLHDIIFLQLQGNDTWILLLSPTVYAAEGRTDNSAALLDPLEVLLHVQSNSSNNKMTTTTEKRIEDVIETRSAME